MLNRKIGNTIARQWFPILFLSLLVLTSCKDDVHPDQGELTTEQYSMVHPETGETLYFQSSSELLDALKGSEYYEAAEQKLTAFESEFRFIEQNRLYDLDTKDPRVVDYLNKLEQKILRQHSNNGRATWATSGKLYDGDNATGEVLGDTTTPKSKMGSSERNRASSIKGPVPGSVILCDRTWFRGTRHLVIVPPFISRNLDGFDNRTESYF